MKNHNATTTGTGNLSAVRFSDFRKTRLEKFNQELVAQAFLRDGCMIDLSPDWNNSLLLWEVSATEESGNCEASASFSTYKEALRFIDGLCLLAEMKEKAEALSHE